MEKFQKEFLRLFLFFLISSDTDTRKTGGGYVFTSGGGSYRKRGRLKTLPTLPDAILLLAFFFVGKDVYFLPTGFPLV